MSIILQLRWYCVNKMSTMLQFWWYCVNKMSTMLQFRWYCVNKMSTPLQFRWYCVNKMSTMLQFEWYCADIFSRRPMYPNVSFDKVAFRHVAAAGNNEVDDYDVTFASQDVSTSCFVLIFKQAKYISIKCLCLSLPFDEYTVHILNLL